MYSASWRMPSTRDSRGWASSSSVPCRSRGRPPWSSSPWARSTGDYRFAILVLPIFWLGGLAIFWFCVDVDKGLAEVEATLDKRKSGGGAAPPPPPRRRRRRSTALVHRLHPSFRSPPVLPASSNLVIFTTQGCSSRPSSTTLTVRAGDDVRPVRVFRFELVRSLAVRENEHGTVDRIGERTRGHRCGPATISLMRPRWPAR